MMTLRPIALSAAVAVTVIAGPVLAQAPSSTQVARSDAGVVATAHPLATAAATRMLELGGNAADAAVAAAFALAVVEPSMNGIGGRTQILMHLPSGEIRGIDATTQAPATYDPETAPQARYGYPTVGVPGAVAGLMRLHGEYGTLPRETVMAPAIDYAEHGVRLLKAEALRQSMAATQVGEFEGGTYFQTADGSSYGAGELFVQTDLAWTLRAIAMGGADAFYRGAVAERIVRDMEAKGGAVTRKSLAEYEAVDGQIVRGSYRGYELAAMYLPTAGAVTIEILQILENFDLSSMGPVEWAAVVGQAMALAFQDSRLQGQPGADEKLTSKEFARERANEVRVPEGVTTGGLSIPEQPERPDDDGHTTHMSVVDADGFAISLTQTVGPLMGSKVVAPGLGFVYAATLGGYLGDMKPGERANSFISPLMVLKDGRPVLVLGAAGGARIVSAVAQAVLRVIDQDKSLPEALAAPRIHPGFDGSLELETSPGVGWSPDVVEALRAMGLEVRTQDGIGRFGRVHALRFHPETGEWEAVAEPDWEGVAAAAVRR